MYVFTIAIGNDKFLFAWSAFNLINDTHRVLDRELVSQSITDPHTLYDPRSSSSIPSSRGVGFADVLSTLPLTLKGNTNLTAKATRPERVNALFGAAAFEACTTISRSACSTTKIGLGQREALTGNRQYIRAHLTFAYMYTNSLNSNCRWFQFLKGPEGFSQGTASQLLNLTCRTHVRSDEHYIINMQPLRL